jgi:hypothetical protein
VFVDSRLLKGKKSLYESLFDQTYGTRSSRIPAEKPPHN